MNIKTNLFTLLACLSFILFLSFFTSCQTKETLKTPDNGAPLPSADGECTLEEERRFQLEEIDPLSNGSSASYAFRLENTSGPYNLAGCICAVQEYDLTFVSLPEEFEVKDENGNLIPFTINIDGLNQEMTIHIDNSQMPDIASELHIFFRDERVLSNAGGICVIDNLGGIDRTSSVDFTTTHVDPVKVIYQMNFTSWVTKFIIPTAMTAPL